ncbi:glycosyltransferase family 2 protein [Pontibacillus sp. HMF3514]|uniref:glycosyltransferase n=1 Tax=Pontibacillus sp. HMF3514 TaxID=2692425 RepID=UPI0013201A50|nr:glycosyltransferase [Pontibacillus sp. HMF3514]QHE51975.1 glycosyltransferase [Pontibacillus sp. HMF3514]
MDNFLYGLIIVEVGLLLWIGFNSLFVIRLQSSKKQYGQRVSILIPLRDEEQNVKGLIASLKKVDHDHIEFMLLDDSSTDQTYSLLIDKTTNDSRFQILQGDPLPKGWSGKVFACHQLSQKANGEYLFFIDADVRVAPNIVSETLHTMKKEKAHMLSGFPYYPASGIWPQLLITLQHFVVHAHLPIPIANHSYNPSFTAASGGFIAIERTTYEMIGGHQALKRSILEDIQLARLVKKHRKRMILVNITSSVTCYMYHTLRDAFDGFTKNIFEGIGRSKIMAIFLSLFYFSVYVTPLFFLISGVLFMDWLYIVPYLLVTLQKFIVDLQTRTNGFFALGMPISAVLLILVLWRSMYKSVTGKTYKWKGRSYQ